MARAPVAGRTKTRLIPVLGAAGAARLSSAMTADVLLIAQSTGLPWRVCLAEPHPLFTGLPTITQADGDLGARLTSALGGGGLAIGTDCVLLTAEMLRDAHDAVIGGGLDLVLGLAADGGYTYAAASARAVALGVFAGIPWSSPDTAGAQLKRAGALGLTTHTTPGTFDVDEGADLLLLQTTLAALPGDVGPHTRRALAELLVDPAVVGRARTR
jgi:hypothetical protein